jgi:chromosome segregation ATPase
VIAPSHGDALTVDMRRPAVADDIVTRLRTVPTLTADNCEQLSELTEEAADRIESQEAEIERLRAENDELRGDLLMKVHRIGELADEADRLRAAGDALVKALETNMMATAVVLLNEWKEIRRG